MLRVSGYCQRWEACGAYYSARPRIHSGHNGGEAQNKVQCSTKLLPLAPKELESQLSYDPRPNNHSSERRSGDCKCEILKLCEGKRSSLSKRAKLNNDSFEP